MNEVDQTVAQHATITVEIKDCDLTERDVSHVLDSLLETGLIACGSHSDANTLRMSFKKPAPGKAIHQEDYEEIARVVALAVRTALRAKLLGMSSQMGRSANSNEPFLGLEVRNGTESETVLKKDYQLVLANVSMAMQNSFVKKMAKALALTITASFLYGCGGISAEVVSNNDIIIKQVLASADGKPDIFIDPLLGKVMLDFDFDLTARDVDTTPFAELRVLKFATLEEIKKAKGQQSSDIGVSQGICSVYFSKNAAQVIDGTEESWGEVRIAYPEILNSDKASDEVNYLYMKRLVYHELGHCLLGLEHTPRTGHGEHGEEVDNRQIMDTYLATHGKLKIDAFNDDVDHFAEYAKKNGR